MASVGGHPQLVKAKEWPAIMLDVLPRYPALWNLKLTKYSNNSVRKKTWEKVLDDVWELSRNETLTGW